MFLNLFSGKKWLIKHNHNRNKKVNFEKKKLLKMFHFKSFAKDGCEMTDQQNQITIVKDLQEEITTVKVTKSRKRRRPPNLLTLTLVTLALLGTRVDCQKIQVTEFNQTSIRDQVN